MAEENDLTGHRVGIFADTHNLFYTGRDLYESKIDYRALKRHLSGTRDLIVANAYLLIKDASKSESFEMALKKSGYIVKTKEQVFRETNSYKPNEDFKEEPRKKNVISWEVGISIDMIKWVKKLDTIILVSGNGIYEDALLHLKSFGINIEIAGFRESTSGKLLNLADNFINLSPRDANDLPEWLQLEEPVLKG